MWLLCILLAGTGSAALQPHVVVVGGGVGGLTTAGRLARRGARVTVLEKTNRLGGRVGEYRWQNHRWETGASLLLLPDVYRDALEAVGADQLDVKRVQPAYAVWYETLSDRGPVILGGDRTELRRRLELEAPGGFERFEEYRATAREYLCGNQNFTARTCWIAASSSTPSTRCLLDGVAMPVLLRSTEPGRRRHRREMT